MNLNFSNQVGIVVGDFMLDEYLYTEFVKDSPECNAPVVRIDKSNHFPGGAGNVVMNLNALGVEVIPVGFIGDDEKGHKLLDIFKSNGINTNYIQYSSNVNTTHKKRLYIDRFQKIRIDSDSKYSNLNNIHSSVLKSLSVPIQSCNFFILSDYNKGLITKDFSQKVIKMCNDLDIPVIVDPKKESLEYYRGASTITPNKKEAKLLCDSKNFEHLISFFQSEIIRLNIKSVLFKVGQDGMIVITKDYIKKIKGIDVKNPDVTGAGDTVISIFSIMLSLNNNLIDCATVANIGASLVVAKEETSTVSYNELLNTIKKLI